MKRLTFQEKLNYINDLGYELINNDIVNYKMKLTLKDSNGYFYYTSFHELYRDHSPSIVHLNNPYSLNNIKLFLKLNYDKEYILMNDKYIGAKDKLTFYDKEGFYYTSSWISLQDGRILFKFYKNNPYTIQNIHLWCKLNNKPFELISDKYKNVTDDLQWKCLVDNEIWNADMNSVLNGRGCPYCVGQKVGLSNCVATKRPDLTLQWHPVKNGDLTPYDVTCGSNDSVWWICEKGHEWSATIGSRKNSGCPYCSGRNPTDDNNLLKVNPELCKEWDYEKNDKNPEEYTPNSQQYVYWICNICKHSWRAKIQPRNNGSGCPECNESKGEKQLDLILTNYNIFHDSQYTFDDLVGLGGGLLRFDASIFWDKDQTQLKMLIEYDGIQHFEWVKGWMTKKKFETIQYHDKLKDEYAQKHNIKLLRIPYWDFDNIESILSKELNLTTLTNNLEVVAI